MKSISFITVAITVMICACGQTTLLLDQIPGSTTISRMDFTPYANSGFLFTPNVYTGEYESIGMLEVTIMPEAHLDSILPGTIIEELVWQVNDKGVRIQTALDEIYEACIEMGADALTQMTIEVESQSYAYITNPPLTIMGITISGFAIDRK